MSDQLHLGAVIDHKYRIVRQLGTGGMGVVYAAERLTLGDVVAIKCILPHRNSEMNRARFLQEARAAARIRHPNVVQVFDFGELDAEGTPYMVMEYLDGPTLSDILADPPRPALPRALAMFADVCSAVAAGHRRGVVHRDIKPGNVIIAQSDGGHEAAKVLDFGLARVAEQPGQASAPDLLIGTAYYMSPEQVSGRPVSPASDVFALTVLLYELATGALPFRGENTVNTLYKITEGDYTPPRAHVPELDDAVVAAIEAGLSLDPKDRPRSPIELAELAGAPVRHPETLSSGSIPRTPAPSTAGTPDDAAATAELHSIGGRDRVFIGREEELAAVEQVLATAGTEGRFVLVMGEAGVGKTRFLEEARARLAAAGAKVVGGRFFAYEGDRPPPHEAFAWMVDAVGMRPGGEALEEPDRWQLFGSTARALVDLAAPKPLVIAVDDLQWASQLDVEFLSYLPHAVRGHPVLVIATARPDIPPEIENFVSKLASTRRLRRLTLAPFDSRQTYAWLQATFGALRIRPADVRRIHHVTTGSPFAIAEVVRQLVDTDRIRREDDDWACDDLFDVGLPDTVQALVESRLAELDPMVREALEIACVVGEEVRFETVQAASGLSEEDLETRLEEATRQRVLTDRGLSPGSDYRFRSNALRAVLYDSLSARRRRRLHRRVVEALGKLYAGEESRLAGVLAHHYAAIGDWRPALAAALTAAQQSFALYDTDGANAALQRARRAVAELGEPLPPQEQAELEYLVGAVATRLGRIDEAIPQLQRAVELAEEAGRAALAVDGLLALVDAQLGRGDFRAGVAAGHRAIERAQAIADWPREAAARVKVSTCTSPLGRFDDSRAAIEPVLASTRREDAGVRALAARELAWIEVKLGHFGAAVRAAEQSVSEARLAGDAMARYRAQSALGLVHAECGDYNAAAAQLREALELARALSLRRREGIELGNLGETLLLLGETEEALEQARRGLAIFIEIRDRACEGDCRVNVGRILRQLGRREEARAMLDLGRDRCAASGRVEYEAIALCELAELRLEDGDPMLSRALFDQAHKKFESIGAALGWRAVFGRAKALRSLGRPEESRALAAKAKALVEAQLETMPAGIDATELTRARAELDRFAAKEPHPTRVEADIEPADRRLLDGQHRELQSLAGELFRHLPAHDADRVDNIHNLLRRFLTQLRDHARSENRGLYPRLLQHENEQIRTTAETLYAEGMGLYDDYYTFADRWRTPTDILTDPDRFTTELHTVFRRLGTRMRREEAELHPLAEL